MTFAVTCVDLEIVKLSEVTEKEKYHIISFTYGIYKISTDKSLYKMEIESHMLKTNIRLPRGKGGGERVN